MKNQALCPVAEIAGDIHHFVVGTGVRVEWHVMGDTRTEVEVCASCADCGEDDAR